jgi:heme/copper-type cytochrome/quinol oxidase subunit 2
MSSQKEPMRPPSRPLIVVVAVVALAALFLVLRPAVGGPRDRSFDITVSSAGMSPGTLQVREGDSVTIRIAADADVRFHLHGYDLKTDVRPGAPAALAFRADKTGKFEIEDEGTERPLGTLVVEPR